MTTEELRYLQRLAELYPTIGKASTEIINLQSILNLPKGTEHFLSDIHGEYQAFSHVLRNGSGAVRKKVDDVFGHTLSNQDKRSLATLIYYPKEKIELVKKQEEDMENWYKITLYRLIEVCKTTASKYTRSKVRKALPADYAYVIEELITEKAEVLDKEAYYDALQRADQGWHEGTNDPKPFIKYMLSIILSCYKEFEARVSIAYVSGAKSTSYDVVKAYVSERIGKFSKQEVLMGCPSLGSSSVESALKKLVEDGTLVRIGAGRKTMYARADSTIS